MTFDKNLDIKNLDYDISKQDEIVRRRQIGRHTDNSVYIRFMYCALRSNVRNMIQDVSNSGSNDIVQKLDVQTAPWRL